MLKKILFYGLYSNFVYPLLYDAQAMQDKDILFHIKIHTGSLVTQGRSTFFKNSFNSISFNLLCKSSSSSNPYTPCKNLVISLEPLNWSEWYEIWTE